jgi:HAMP domain-containing protein
MDLRTKLIFAFVATSLASMALLGWFSYVESRDMLREATVRQLESLASARAEDLGVIVEALQNEVRLIQSRTALREQVAAFPRRPDPSREAIQRIIDDAQASVDNITGISVFDIEGELIARNGLPPDGDRLLGTNRAGATVTRFFEGPGGVITAELEASLQLDGALVGSLATEVAVGRLVGIAGNYEGLGETGELLLVAEFEEGWVTFLSPLRHRRTDRLPVVPKAEVSEAVRMALAGEEGFLEGTLDYRGERVWAAVEGMPQLPVGLVVKVDEEEELLPIRELRDRLLRAALSVAALAILGGALVGAWLALPIRALRDVVQSIREGDVEQRADTSGEDEVSFLAECFNRLMDDIHGPGHPPKHDGEDP